MCVAYVPSVWTHACEGVCAHAACLWRSEEDGWYPVLTLSTSLPWELGSRLTDTKAQWGSQLWTPILECSYTNGLSCRCSGYKLSLHACTTSALTYWAISTDSTNHFVFPSYTIMVHGTLKVSFLSNVSCYSEWFILYLIWPGWNILTISAKFRT